MTLHTHAKNGYVNGVRSELAKGVSVDQRDDNGFTALAYAVSNPSVTSELLSLLVDAGADVNVIVGERKSSLLAIAASSGNLHATKFLLDAGALVNVVLPKGYSPLLGCIYSLCTDDALLPMLRLLVDRGADVDCESDYGERPVTVASRLGRFDAVRLLLDAGAEASPLKWSELATAVAIGSEDDVAQVLSSRGLQSEWDHCGRTPGLLAATVGSIAKGQQLVSHGWNVNEEGRSQDTALMVCASANHVGMLTWLIDEGAVVEAVDDSQNTALMLAVQAGSANAVRQLLLAGANPDVQNEYGNTPMAYASTIEMVRQLQDAGVDLGLTNVEMKRQLTGLSNCNSIDCSLQDYKAGKRRQYGNANPQRMVNEFWRAMVRAGASAFEARARFDDTRGLDDPVWCFSRFGSSFTELPDGRLVQIGGEHEDFYDPDFCIYNDVVVHSGHGQFSIYGYSPDDFRPTDFHTATYHDDHIYIVGCLGYHGTRTYGTTPVYQVSCTNWSIVSMESTGENPGWIFEHTTRLHEPEVLRVSGGKVAIENDGKEIHQALEGSYTLNLRTMRWTRSDG